MAVLRWRQGNLRMGERRSISSTHVFWQEQDSIPGWWYIATRHAYGEAGADARQPDWDGPPPKNYQRHDAEKLRAHLELWEPESRVVMHMEGV